MASEWPVDPTLLSRPAPDLATAGRRFPVREEAVIEGDAGEKFYRLYADAFAPLRTRSAARQVLHRDEFLAEMSDARVSKFVIWDGAEPIGMATLTQHLESVPWISPEFFRARYPEHAARNAIFYLGFILVHPHRQRDRLLEQLIEAGIPRLVEARAVCGYDICQFNEDSFGLATRLQTLLHSLADVEVARIDTQTYFHVDFW